MLTVLQYNLLLLPQRDLKYWPTINGLFVKIQEVPFKVQP